MTNRASTSPGAPVESFGDIVRAVWRLTYPLWVSPKRWWAYGLLAIVIADTVWSTYLLVWYTSWNGRFMDALAHYDAAHIISIVEQFAALMTCFVGLATVSLFARSAMQILWRQCLTERFIGRWLARDAFYRIEREQLVDNPDQRITQDIDQFVSVTYTLSTGLFSTVGRFATFSVILWRLSGPIDLPIGEHIIRVGGYMLWVALLYAVVTSALVHWIGRRLGALTFAKERAEADFRFMMTGVREYAEQIALYHGTEAESRRMQSAFEVVRKNFWQIVRLNLRLHPLTILLAYLSNVFPMFVVLPRYFSHAITLGGMTRLSSSFAEVQGSLSWFIYNYASLQTYRVMVSRLDSLEQATRLSAVPRERSPDEIDYVREPRDALCVDNLSLRTPDGRTLVDSINFSVVTGERWLIRGPSGTGKSTLVRALAGIWPYGSGRIEVPDTARVLFLSQKNYVPAGTLKAALCYPSSADAFDDRLCRQALLDCRLTQYAECLDEVARWGHCLSPGEQQRLAFGRALLQRPDYLLLDESTSALDPGTEHYLYEMLVRQLPNTALISISHREALEEFHKHTVRIGDAYESRTVAA